MYPDSLLFIPLVVDLLLYSLSSLQKFQWWKIGLPHSTVPSRITVMLTAMLGSGKHNTLWFWFDSAGGWFQTMACTQEVSAELIRPFGTFSLAQ